LIASLWLAAVAPPAAAQVPAPATAEAPADMPPWMRRGLPAAGYAALAPLAGKWRVRLSIHATLGRSPDGPADHLRGPRLRAGLGGGRTLPGGRDHRHGGGGGGAYWRKGCHARWRRSWGRKASVSCAFDHIASATPLDQIQIFPSVGRRSFGGGLDSPQATAVIGGCRQHGGFFGVRQCRRDDGDGGKPDLRHERGLAAPCNASPPQQMPHA
jgi:hypothetical protein